MIVTNDIIAGKKSNFLHKSYLTKELANNKKTDLELYSPRPQRKKIIDTQKDVDGYVFPKGCPKRRKSVQHISIEKALKSSSVNPLLRTHLQGVLSNSAEFAGDGIAQFQTRDRRNTLPAQFLSERKDDKTKQRPNVLLVEDIKITQTISKVALKKSKFKVTIATSGIEAIQQFQVKHFDLIIMDILMPEMSGISATQQIRALEEREKRPKALIYGMTTHCDLESLKTYKKCGMDGCIEKGTLLSKAFNAIKRTFNDPTKERGWRLFTKQGTVKKLKSCSP